MTDRTRVGVSRFSLWTRVVCCLLCGVLLLTLSQSASLPQTARAQTVDELTSEKDALAAQQDALEAQRDQTAATLEAQKEQTEILRQQIAVQSEKIAVSQQILSQYDTQIADIETRIAEQEASIVSLEQQIVEQRELLGDRLRNISKRNSAITALQLLIDSSSYTEYLIGFKMSERISAHDQQLMDEFNAAITDLETAKAQNQTDKAALEIERTKAAAAHEELTADKASLQALYNEAAALEESIAQNVEDLEEQIAALDAKQNALQNTINEVLAQIKAEEEAKREEENGGGSIIGSVPSMSGTMTWPAPTCTLITSSYKYRPQFGRWHKGIDIACYGTALGQPIVAAADGRVVYANRYDTWGGGFGLYLMIDHGYDSAGRRILTVYAHCNEVTAYAGQTVNAGDLVGYIGNTGNSFGAHLHFEVQVDGTAVDPIANGYLSTNGIEFYG